MNILLICSAGMSTCMLMKKMQQAAASRHINAKIWAVQANLAPDHIGQADIILLSPQVRYLQDEICQMAQGKPVMPIDLESYGNLNGEQVLKTAMHQVIRQVGR